MKIRRISVWLLAVILLLSLAVPALAAEDDSQAKLGYVNDTAGLLTADQKNALLNRATELSQEYHISIYIIAVQDYTKYSNASEISDACIDIFDNYDLGWGENRDAATFLISMDTREFNFDFNGDWAHYAFTEGGRDRMEDRVLPYLRDNDYYGGFNEYLNVCQDFLQAATEGTPIGEGEISRNDAQGGFSILFFLPGLFVAGVYAVILIVPMHTANIKTQADDYIVPGSMRLTRQSDHFLRRTVSRTPRQKETDHSGPSGGSVSHSYSSGSHSGRSGKF